MELPPEEHRERESRRTTRLRRDERIEGKSLLWINEMLRWFPYFLDLPPTTKTEGQHEREKEAEIHYWITTGNEEERPRDFFS